MPSDIVIAPSRPLPKRTVVVDAEATPLPLLKWLFVTFSVAVYSDGLVPVIINLRGGAEQIGQSDIASTICQLFILSVLAVYVLRNWRIVVPRLGMMPLYLLTVLLCWISAGWSEFPMITLRRSVTLTVCIMFGVYCSIEVGLRRMINIVAQTMLILGALSVLTYFALPGVGHDSSEGYSAAMRGVFSQKNPAGEAMLLGIICVCHNILLGRGKAVRHYVSIGFLLLCIGLTLSATSLMISFLTIAAAVTVRTWKTPWRPVALFFAATVTALVMFLLIFDVDLLFALMQRDSSFTGRLPLWIQSFHIAFEQPILGFGYSAFWVSDSPIVQYLWRMVGWEAPSSHNGYLDIMLQIGVVGLALYVAVWSGMIVRSVKAIRQGIAPESYWILIFMIMNLILNLDEGPLPYPDQFTMMMPLSLIYLAIWRARQPRATSLVTRRVAPHRV